MTNDKCVCICNIYTQCISSSPPLGTASNMAKPNAP